MCCGIIERIHWRAIRSLAHKSHHTHKHTPYKLGWQLTAVYTLSLSRSLASFALTANANNTLDATLASVCLIHAPATVNTTFSPPPLRSHSAQRSASQSFISDTIHSHRPFLFEKLQQQDVVKYHLCAAKETKKQTKFIHVVLIILFNLCSIFSVVRIEYIRIYHLQNLIHILNSVICSQTKNKNSKQT